MAVYDRLRQRNIKEPERNSEISTSTDTMAMWPFSEILSSVVA
jgi:hypothetical protein